MLKATPQRKCHKDKDTHKNIHDVGGYFNKNKVTENSD